MLYRGVFVSEFGHNWGSEHDPDTDECSPNAFKGGKYIMYTYSVSGYDTNNKVSTLVNTELFCINPFATEGSLFRRTVAI